ncbi:hypothetical protein L484_000193 [Morus notabilis]|uniref:Uncharacterized protein n=1 Tax=Morus notabilis TaxID=981085 RepID=W9SE59_9ROSA|nr:hypothetical protein L484_000193 [Morus notabilis]
MANIVSLLCLLAITLVVFDHHGRIMASQIDLGSRLLAKENKAWVSENGTFAFGFTPIKDEDDKLQLAIWFANLPGDRTTVWSPSRYFLLIYISRPFG